MLITVNGKQVDVAADPDTMLSGARLRQLPMLPERVLAVMKG